MNKLFVWRWNRFSTTDSGSKFGAVHKQCRPLVGGVSSKIDQNCRRIVLKNCQCWGEGVKNPEVLLSSFMHGPLLRIFLKFNRVGSQLLSYCAQLRSTPSVWPGTQLFRLDPAIPCFERFLKGGGKAYVWFSTYKKIQIFFSCHCIYLFKNCPSQFLSHWESAEPVFCSEELSFLPFKNQNKSLISDLGVVENFT